MSGGSFDYLFLASDIQALAEHAGELDAMSEELSRLDRAGVPGARECKELTDGVISSFASAMHGAQRLRDAWKAVEWTKSGDWDSAKLRAALLPYVEK